MQLPNDAFRVREDGSGAQLSAKQVPLIDQFVFQGQIDVRWQATGPRMKRGSGRTVAPTDPEGIDRPLILGDEVT